MFFRKRADHAKRDDNSTTIPAPLEWVPSGTFDGNDGNWSTFIINVGNTNYDGQDFRVHISTSGSLTQVPMQASWCDVPDQSTCAAARGIQKFQSKQSLGFDPTVSKTWKQYGTYNLPLPQALDWTPDASPNASYGQDTVGMGSSSPASTMQLQQFIAEYNTEDFFMGSFGLSATAVNPGAGPVAPWIVNLQNNNATPSLSYGYTAGASYRNTGVVGSLIFGGYDDSRLTLASGTSIGMPSGNQSLIVGVQNVQYSPDRSVSSNVESMMNGTNGFFATIDSTLPYLWLPQTICDEFADKFQLTWDSDRKLYTISDSAHSYNQQQNATVQFKIGDLAVSNNKYTSISLPYEAFALQATYPLNGYTNNTGVRYFPLKRSPTGVFVLGRAFLQEAYLIVDYERGNFTVAPANYASPMPDKHIVTIFSKTYTAPNTSPTGRSNGGGGGLSGGAIAGIAVGVVIAILLALLGAFFFWKKKRDARKKQEEKVSEIDTEEAGREVKDRRISELDSQPPYSPKGSTIGGYYGERDQKDTPFPPITEMESPHETAELESPDSGVTSRSPHSEITDYFQGVRPRRRGATRESPGGGTPGTPGTPGARFELAGDDGHYAVGGQHFEPVASPVHSRGPSDASTQSGIDTVISGQQLAPQSPRSPHQRGPSEAPTVRSEVPTVQSESTAISDPTTEQLEAWALGHDELGRRSYSPPGDRTLSPLGERTLSPLGARTLSPASDRTYSPERGLSPDGDRSLYATADRSLSPPAPRPHRDHSEDTNVD